MGDQVLAVQADELDRRLRFECFKALPEEEILRLGDTIEVVALERDLVQHDPRYRQLAVYTVVHHNYRWLTFLRNDSGRPCRALGIGAEVLASEREVRFLDDQLAIDARRAVDDAVVVSGHYELRLAGMLKDDASAADRRQLCLIYVARLRLPSVAPRDALTAQLQLLGTTELQFQRDQFDTRSQVLIDHVLAL